DSFDFPAQLLPALDAAEGAEAGGDLVWFQPQRPAGGVDAQRVLDVVAAGSRQVHADLRLALVIHLEGGAGGAEVDPARMPVGLHLVARAVAFDLALRERRESLPVGE